MKRRLNLSFVVLSLGIAGCYSFSPIGQTIVAAQGTKIRWDIVSIPPAAPGATTLDLLPGGMAYALIANGTQVLKLTGSGTLGPTVSDPVTGGGTWAREDGTSGTYMVTGLVSFQVETGTLGAAFIDSIGNHMDFRAGLAVLRVAYSDGSGGVLTVSSTGTGTPATVLQGVIATKDFRAFWNRWVGIQAAINANNTAFHVVR